MSAYRDTLNATVLQAESLEQELSDLRHLHEKDERRVAELKAMLSQIEVLEKILRRNIGENDLSLQDHLDALSENVSGCITLGVGCLILWYRTQ